MKITAERLQRRRRRRRRQRWWWWWSSETLHIYCVWKWDKVATTDRIISLKKCTWEWCAVCARASITFELTQTLCSTQLKSNTGNWDGISFRLVRNVNLTVWNSLLCCVKRKSAIDKVRTKKIKIKKKSEDNHVHAHDHLILIVYCCVINGDCATAAHGKFDRIRDSFFFAIVFICHHESIDTNRLNYRNLCVRLLRNVLPSIDTQTQNTHPFDSIISMFIVVTVNYATVSSRIFSTDEWQITMKCSNNNLIALELI